MKTQSFGLGLRPPHYPHIVTKTPKTVDWFEIITENFLGVGGAPLERVRQIRRDYPMVLHGVGLSIAGADPLDQDYLRQQKELMSQLEPFLVSDHLCFTSLGGAHSHDLLPSPLTHESLAHVCDRVLRVQDFLGQRILLENPSCYLSFKGQDMSEAQFLKELCQKTGCGILLDINNLFVNQQNLGWPPEEYFAELGPQHVLQMHLAGHSIEGPIRVDTHDQPVPPEVWQLFKTAVTHFPEAHPMIEWDDHIPEFEVLEQELAKARALAREAAKDPRPASFDKLNHHGIQPESVQLSWQSVQERLFHTVTSGDGAEDEPTELVSTPCYPSTLAFHVYRQGYFQRIRSVLEDSFPTLHYIVEDQGLDLLCDAYLRHHPPSHVSLDFVGQRLAGFLAESTELADFGIPQSMLADLALFDYTRLALYLQQDDPQLSSRGQLAALTPEQWQEAYFELARDGLVRELSWDPTEVWQAMTRGDEEAPPPPEACPTRLLFLRQAGQVHHYPLRDEDYSLWLALKRGGLCMEILADSQPSGWSQDSWLEHGVAQLLHWPVRYRPGTVEDHTAGGH